ncbi:hypothetical protein ACFX2H_043707 [Malus domestica]
MVSPTTTKALPEILEKTQSLSDISHSSSLKGKTKSSRSSKTTSLKKKEKSSQLKELVDKLMAEATLLHNEKEDTNSDSSDASSQPIKWADYPPDSQDPFEI